jgi:hypothetical protein
MRQLIFSNLHNPSSCTVALGFTQPPKGSEYQKMFLGNRARLVHKAGILIAICELIAWTVWNPRQLATI